MSTIVEDTQRALLELHKETNKEWISLREIYEKVEEIRKESNANNGASIRAALETHCKLSDVFRGEELFLLKEKGSGLYKSIEYDKMNMHIDTSKLKFILHNFEYEIELEKQQQEINSLSENQLHDLAIKKDIQPIKKIIEVPYVERDQIISRYTKNRAKGKCDLCEQNAPFETKDGPYLECHHVVTIADGGPDVIYNTVALCPNCHRKIHGLKDPKDLKKLTEVIYNYLLSDNDRENIKKWEELFK